jgi:hypothetical protein
VLDTQDKHPHLAELHLPTAPVVAVVDIALDLFEVLLVE